jgi:hypothetical protein
MMQALGIFAAGFLLHYILNRPMTPMPQSGSESETPMPPSETTPVLEAYTNGGYSLMDFDGGMPVKDADPGGMRYVVFEGGQALKGPDGKAAYTFPGTQAGFDAGKARVDALAAPRDNPPELPEPSPTPPQDLPGMPGSSGGLGGGVGSSLTDSLPTADEDVSQNIGIGTDARKELIGSMKYGNDFPGLGVY